MCPLVIYNPAVHVAFEEAADHQVQHQPGRRNPPLAANLTGTLMVSADRARLRGPLSRDISLELTFSKDGTQVFFAPIDLSTVLGQVRVVSGGDPGRFHCSSGLMEIPVRAHASSGGRMLGVNLTLSTESGDAHGPFKPRGVRLQTDGSLTLAGAASATAFGIRINVLIVVLATVHPLP